MNIEVLKWWVQRSNYALGPSEYLLSCKLRFFVYKISTLPVVVQLNTQRLLNFVRNLVTKLYSCFSNFLTCGEYKENTTLCYFLDFFFSEIHVFKFSKTNLNKKYSVTLQAIIFEKECNEPHILRDLIATCGVQDMWDKWGHYGKNHKHTILHLNSYINPEYWTLYPIYIKIMSLFKCFNLYLKQNILFLV